MDAQKSSHHQGRFPLETCTSSRPARACCARCLCSSALRNASALTTSRRKHSRSHSAAPSAGGVPTPVSTPAAASNDSATAQSTMGDGVAISLTSHRCRQCLAAGDNPPTFWHAVGRLHQRHRCHGACSRRERPSVSPCALRSRRGRRTDAAAPCVLRLLPSSLCTSTH